MLRLSIIIPVLGSSARLEGTLVSVLENRPPDCEILVVHNAPYADPYDLAGEIRFLPVASGSSLVESLNAGIQASGGAVVHLLAAGFEAAEGWTEPALAHFQDRRVASVAPVVVDSLGMQVTLAAGLQYSCRRGRTVRTDATLASEATPSSSQAQQGEVLGPLLQAAFYRRSALELVGGLPRAVGDALADADLALALKSAGYRSVLEPRSIVSATAGDIAAPQPGFRQGLTAERLFWRTAPTVGWRKSLAAHPLGVLSEFLQALPQAGALTALAGRLLGACQIGSHRAHHQWLLDIEGTAAALFRGERAGYLRIDGPHASGELTRAERARVSVESL